MDSSHHYTIVIDSMRQESAYLLRDSYDYIIRSNPSKGGVRGGFKTAIHKQGVETFMDLGETMVNHMKLCFYTEVIEYTRKQGGR